MPGARVSHSRDCYYNVQISECWYVRRQALYIFKKFVSYLLDRNILVSLVFLPVYHEPIAKQKNLYLIKLYFLNPSLINSLGITARNITTIVNNIKFKWPIKRPFFWGITLLYLEEHVQAPRKSSYSTAFIQNILISGQHTSRTKIKA